MSQAAGDALLDRGDLVGVRLYAEAMALADNDTIDHLWDCVADGTGARARLLAELLPQLLDDPSDVVRASAVELLGDVQRMLA